MKPFTIQELEAIERVLIGAPLTPEESDYFHDAMLKMKSARATGELKCPPHTSFTAFWFRHHKAYCAKLVARYVKLAPVNPRAGLCTKCDAYSYSGLCDLCESEEKILAAINSK